MFNRSDILFLVAVGINLSLLIIAIRLIAQGLFRWKVYWLIVYVVLTVYTEYAVAAVKLDRVLERGGILWRHITLPTNINFARDLAARIALLVAIWLLLIDMLRRRN